MARRKKSAREKDTAEVAQKRVLARLQLARSDIHMARQMCETALTMDLVKQDPVSWAFHHAVVVTYARPFVSNDSVGALGAKWERFDDPKMEENHRTVMSQRDEVVAHAELRWRPVVLAGANTQLPSGIITVRPGVFAARPVLESVSYQAVLLLCEDLLPRLSAAFDERFLKLFPNGYHGPPIELLPGVAEGEPGLRITVG